MSIKVEPDAVALTVTGYSFEDCIFCGFETAFWHTETNRPVCTACSMIHEPEEITTAPFNY